ncbi:hypothetical protein F7P69_20880 [Cellulosimicrobium funkei]|nr:hypothetical protein [Cellulosimicrobium funkei]
MAFGGYDINVDEARGVVSTARTTFTALEGIENSIQTDADAAAGATEEGEIQQAMTDVLTNFLRPFVVTMVNSGKHVFDTTDNVITTYDNADSDISLQSSAATDMVEDVADIGETPDYSSTTTTGNGDDPHEGYEPAPSSGTGGASS